MHSICTLLFSSSSLGGIGSSYHYHFLHPNYPCPHIFLRGIVQSLEKQSLPCKFKIIAQISAVCLLKLYFSIMVFPSKFQPTMKLEMKRHHHVVQGETCFYGAWAVIVGIPILDGRGDVMLCIYPMSLFSLCHIVFNCSCFVLFVISSIPIYMYSLYKFFGLTKIVPTTRLILLSSTVTKTLMVFLQCSYCTLPTFLPFIYN